MHQVYMNLKWKKCFSNISFASFLELECFGFKVLLLVSLMSALEVASRAVRNEWPRMLKGLVLLLFAFLIIAPQLKTYLNGRIN